VRPPREVGPPPRLPEPPPGKQYFFMPIDAELVDKALRLEPYWEDQLLETIEETVRTFLETRPIALRVPS
jgi:hypothetical protein